MRNLFVLSVVFLFIVTSCKDENKSNPPNIIIIYADDLGYGDVSSYGLGTLNTPNIDKIANQGTRFTSGYSSSATCSPSRYALLTGTYPWRNKRAKILTGANLIIDTTEMTLPKIAATDPSKCRSSARLRNFQTCIISSPPFAAPCAPTPARLRLCATVFRAARSPARRKFRPWA